MTSQTTSPRGTSGAISVGMVLVPIRTYGAIKSSGSSGFNMVHKACGGKVNQGAYRCPACDVSLTRDEIGKGKEIAKQMIQFTDEELDSLPLRTTKAIDVVSFVDDSEIDPIMFERFDYIGPDPKAPGSEKVFVLLREAMERNHKVAICKTQSAGKERLCVIRPRGKALEMARLHWREDVVDVEVVAQGINDLVVGEREAALIDQLVESMSGDAETVFSTTTDDYRAALEALVESKLQGTPIAVLPAPAAPAADDLLAALTASVAAARAAA